MLLVFNKLNIAGYLSPLNSSMTLLSSPGNSLYPEIESVFLCKGSLEQNQQEIQKIWVYVLRQGERNKISLLQLWLHSDPSWTGRCPGAKAVYYIEPTFSNASLTQNHAHSHTNGWAHTAGVTYIDTWLTIIFHNVFSVSRMYACILRQYELPLPAFFKI